MQTLRQVLAYAVATFVLMIATSMAMTGNGWQATTLILAVALIAPITGRPLEGWFAGRMGRFIRPLLVACCFGVIALMTLLQTSDSIYSSPEVRDRFHTLYAAELETWPVPYETQIVPTDLGTVHVIISGPQDGPAMLLLHASGVSSWSWKHNVAALSGPYRTYAIDLIGDAGLSDFNTLENVMRNGAHQASHYADIMDRLGISSAIVVGASEGGFIGTNLALHAPERVERLILLAPMGYSGATQAIIRITLTQMFPFSALQDSTFRWAFSDDDRLAEEYAEWFPLLMEETLPRKVAPFPISPAERQSLRMPVLFVFGERDNLVGDPAKATALVQDIPDVTVRTVPAGHLMAAEIPQTVDELILRFASGNLTK